MVTLALRPFCLAAIVVFAANSLWAADPAPAVDPAVLAQGRELFGRIWQLNDARTPNGDGLGPVFNATSCAACHNQAGIGGAGSHDRNVRVITISGASSAKKTTILHPGFKTQTSLVLHHSGADSGHYDAWRDRLVARTKISSSPAETSADEVPPQLRNAMIQYQQGLERGAKALAAISSAANPLFGDEPAPLQPSLMCGCGNTGRMGNGNPQPKSTRPQLATTLSVSERNSTSLFGAGLIDQIPEAAIEAVAVEQQAQSPRIAGRVPKLANQRIGRFGWHAQQASLADFTLTACAVELGLSVPGHPQAGNPLKPKYHSPGLDMTAEECAALVAYLAALPRPEEPRAGVPQVEAGRRAFERTGCADCHRPNLGDINGLYSDLLLHDMGNDLKGEAYGAFVADAAAARPAAAGWHGNSEWRTPPLWGVASSAPYLHDGRANTLRDAIAAHGGQAATSVALFTALPAADQQDLLEFLGSLVAPAGAERNRVVEHRPSGWGANAPDRAARRRQRMIDDNARN